VVTVGDGFTEKEEPTVITNANLVLVDVAIF